jgi:uncharacterized membrane protein YpjA
MLMMSYLYYLLSNRFIIIILLIINILGTAYGFYWYGWQLKDTPVQFLAFVPDSPTASLFFVFVLVAFLFGKNWPYLEALAIVTLFKYGVWAVVMNILTRIVDGSLAWQGYMLIFSHACMALEGLLFSPFYRIRMRHLVVAAVWTLHNDIIDYVYMQFPRYESLYMYIREIGYFTFWLSIASISIAYYLTLRRKRLKWSLIS